MPSSEPKGKWFGPYKTPGNSHSSGDGLGVFVIHAVLLHTGKVLWWSGHAETIHYITEAVMWDPLAATVNDPTPNAATVHGSATMPDISNATIIDFPDVDIFCCHHVHTGDGKVITVGGAGPGPHAGDATGQHGRGIRDINIFDPDDPSSGFQKLGDMTEARWYPTAVFMDDESVMVFSGRKDILTGSFIAESVELLVSRHYGTARTVTLNGVHKAQAAAFPTYPGMHLVPGGDVFHTGTTWRYESPGQPTAFNGVPTVSYMMTASAPANTQANCLAYDPPTFLQPNVKLREEGTSILLSPAQDGKILLLGGARMPVSGHTDPPRAAGFRAAHPLVAGSNAKSAEILDTKVLPYAWTAVPDMKHARINVSAVTLVDGRVLVIGGHDFYKWCPASVMALECEIFDPVAKTFSDAASLHDPRIYHCAALLLPDGSVVMAGGVNPNRDEPGNPGMAENQKTFEIYKPSYLFLTGARPVITSVKNERNTDKVIIYGRPFFIETPQFASIRKVVLIRPGAMTHHTDTEQRHIPLEFVVEGTKLKVTMLSDRSIAPAGMYMLFIIDDFEEGRPCEKAMFVLLTSNIAAIFPSAKKSCIIATACYQTPDHPKVQILKTIRDKDISATRFGKWFVRCLNSWYYSFSPAVAGYLDKHKTLRTIVRVMLIRPVILYMHGIKRMTELSSSAQLKSIALIAAFMLWLATMLLAALWLISRCFYLFTYYFLNS